MTPRQVRGRLRSLTLYGGLALVGLGAVLALAAAFVLPQGSQGAAAGASAPATLETPATGGGEDTPTRPTSATYPPSSSALPPASATTTSPTVSTGEGGQAGGGSTEGPSEQIPADAPGSLPADPGQRLERAAVEAGYEVYRLDRPDWKLNEVDLAAFAGDTYVDSVYGNGQDYINLAQGPVTDPNLPNAESLTVRGKPALLLDMGSLLLVQWEEGGSSVRVTSDLDRSALLDLLAELDKVG